MGSRAGSLCKGEVIEKRDGEYAVLIRSGPQSVRGCTVTVDDTMCSEVEFQGKRGRQISWGAPGTGEAESTVEDNITCLIAMKNGQPVVTRWFNASTHASGHRRKGLQRHYSPQGIHNSHAAAW